MQKLSAAIVAFTSFAQANYLSGEVRSQEWFHYGKFVAKMQNPMKMGTVQSFFTYTAQDWPHGWNEIDVEIVPSVVENPFSMNIIWKDGQQEHNYATGFHPGADWFTYTVEWTPDSVSWYVNDKLVRKSEGQEDVHFLNMPTQLMMNFWTPCWSPWNDYFDDVAMPWYAKYDFVEVYDYDQNKKEFNLKWRDDFNTFDSKKWYASDNWGFENNSSLFMSSQVYVEDGNLVLKMDYNDGTPRRYPLDHQIAHSEQPHHDVVVHQTVVHDTPVVHTAAVVHETPLIHHSPYHAAVVHDVSHLGYFEQEDNKKQHPAEAPSHAAGVPTAPHHAAAATADHESAEHTKMVREHSMPPHLTHLEQGNKKHDAPKHAEAPKQHPVEAPHHDPGVPE